MKLLAIKWIQIYSLIGILCIGSSVCYAQLVNTEDSPKSGAIQREIWVNALYKIANPVIDNLANGTLKKNMPIEKGPGYNGDAREVTYLEALGRTLAGVAPWLALPDDHTAEGTLRKQLRMKVLQALKNAGDPANPDYIQFDTKSPQPLVDAAFLAHAFVRAPKALWEPLDQKTKQSYIDNFKSLRTKAGAYNNWLLFSGITEGFLLSIGEQPDPVRIQYALNKFKEWYVGDGWYSDGSLFSMDYYNSFVVQPMLVDLYTVLHNKNRVSDTDFQLVVKRMTRHAEFQERIIAPDGTFPVFGRSVTYRSGAFQVLAQTALLQKLPENIEPAQVRGALTKVFQQLYEGDQNFDENGWLVIGFNGHQPQISDYYTSTGSLYMATLGFLTLGLPANHRFWTDPPAPWTSVKAWSGQSVKKDYKVDY
ncbi:hypothetical protein CLV98_102381 [Dyadobacter jejuensis]|uniref:DUF2264 domain-containing protein n=1 Tax=Dyadobacter jejuensis TaxID=1082580 RepID=A0A316BAH6_9BACT|nr:DUF2264 domain-containing protein [Dyadobacter jejuensis]PWJ59547.1 hypothetical protein CLV98_102381 [Dyadobacter jejuensis]